MQQGFLYGYALRIALSMLKVNRRYCAYFKSWRIRVLRKLNFRGGYT